MLLDSVLHVNFETCTLTSDFHAQWVFGVQPTVPRQPDFVGFSPPQLRHLAHALDSGGGGTFGP